MNNQFNPASQLKLKLLTLVVTLFFVTLSCNDEKKETGKETATTEPMPAKPDMAKLKTEIQTLETAWSTADNARDTNALAAFYSDDAISMSNNKPMLVGKAAIRQDLVESLAKRVGGSTTTYDVVNVFGDENTVTEIGKVTRKDAAGKVTYTGKYMAVWEKRGGKYICISDIGNDDVKEK
jgi:ketosteroid isomerase-like protein